ncbi:hypothetical protein DFH94DRAFT_725040 [Russula ochroleuca]|uniref:Uncharacterized protein n=1 Tax=Russula ochroleuca TaxID=152965 RepID=A0A9P5N1H6_9AGAM|nr:hypothetical protein DFH94DRAFT_725040 [Russula ochroleuca]
MSDNHVVTGAIVAAVAGVALTPLIAPALAGSAIACVFAVAETSFVGGAGGAGLGTVAAALLALTAGAGPGNDKPTDGACGDVTNKTQLVRKGDRDAKGDAEVAAVRKGHNRCPECKRTRERHCWHLYL